MSYKNKTVDNFKTFYESYKGLSINDPDFIQKLEDNAKNFTEEEIKGIMWQLEDALQSGILTYKEKEDGIPRNFRATRYSLQEIKIMIHRAIVFFQLFPSIFANEKQWDKLEEAIRLNNKVIPKDGNFSALTYVYPNLVKEYNHVKKKLKHRDITDRDAYFDHIDDIFDDDD